MSNEYEAHVLLVDDEERFLDVLSHRLETRGMKVETATSGEHALERVADEAFDAIVLDLSMPGMDGIETLRVLKRRRPDMQVIMLTGHGSVRGGIEAMRLGAEDFLEKPIDFAVLMERIREARNKRLLLIERRCQKEVTEILKDTAK